MLPSTAYLLSETFYNWCDKSFAKEYRNYIYLSLFTITIAIVDYYYGLQEAQGDNGLFDEVAVAFGAVYITQATLLYSLSILAAGIGTFIAVYFCTKTLTIRPDGLDLHYDVFNIFIVLIIVSIILTFLNYPDLTKEKVMKAFHAPNCHDIFNIVQSKLKCCGVNSYMDWYHDSEWHNDKFVPDSCCITNDEMPFPEKDCGKTHRPELWYNEGCYHKYEHYFNLKVSDFCDNMRILIVMQCIVFVLVPFWTMCYSMHFLIHQHMPEIANV